MTNHGTVHHRRRVAALVLAASACLPAIAACGSDDEPSEAQGTTTSSTAPPESTAPPTTLTKEQEVEAAFHEVHALIVELNTIDPDPDDPRLAEMLLDPALTDVRDSLASLVATNQLYVPGPESSYEIVNTVVDPNGVTARLTVCAVGADTLIDRDTNDVVSEGVSTIKSEVAYRQQAGRWTMESVLPIQTQDGVAPCGA